MTIGPEPINMMRCRSARRGTDQIFDDGVESELRRPSSRASQLGRVADEDWHLGRADQRSVGVQYRIDTDQSKHTLGERADVDANAAGHVVHGADGAALD